MFKEISEYENKKIDFELIEKIIQNRNSSSKVELDKIELLNRKDKKYIIDSSRLPDLVQSIPSDYQILEIGNNKVFTYENIYFDTDDFYFYHQHHSHKLKREKLRIRKYIQTNTSFFEIKSKSNKKITSKRRIEIPFTMEEIDSSVENFKNSYFEDNLLNISEKLRIIYSRITFFNIFNNEKITVDFNLRYFASKEIRIPNLVIIEHKFSKYSNDIVFADYLKKVNAKKLKISKYCFGLFLSYPKLKFNTFKKRYLKILKIINPRSYNGYNLNLGHEYQLGVFRFYD